MKTYLLVAATFLAGILIGFAVHPVSVKAQDSGSTIWVQEVPPNASVRLHRSNLRGFSCTTDKSDRPDSARCFAATTD